MNFSLYSHVQRWRFNTIVIDADVDLANIELVYGVEAKATLQDLVDGSAKPSDVIHEGPAGVIVVPAGIRLKRR